MMKFVLHAQGFTFKKSYLSIGPPSCGWILVPSKGWKFTVRIKQYSKLEKRGKKIWWKIFFIKLENKENFCGLAGLGYALEKLSG